jgi:hypothetical protein
MLMGVNGTVSCLFLPIMISILLYGIVYQLFY